MSDSSLVGLTSRVYCQLCYYYNLITSKRANAEHVWPFSALQSKHQSRIMSLLTLFARFCQKKNLQPHPSLRKESTLLQKLSLRQPPDVHTIDQTSRRTSLESLPPELILEILSHLSTSSLIALKLTNKRLFLNTPLPREAWMDKAEPCERMAARRYIHERDDSRSGKQQCLICHLVALRSRFSTDIPICKWHDAWFRSTSIPEHVDPLIRLRLEDVARVRKGAVWVPLRRRFCLHEKNIVGWHVTDCKCNCASCGHYSVTCYIRVSGKRDAPTYSQPTEDGSYMSEEHWMISK